MFGNLEVNQTALNEKTDRVGGSFQALKSNIYQAKIEVAYATKSKNGAMGFVVKFAVDSGEDKPRTLTQTFWVSNREGKTYYLDKEGNPHNLAGFNHANQLSSLLTGKGLKDLAFEERQVMLYNAEVKKEALTAVPVASELLDATVALAVIERKVNKQEKSGDTYVDTNEERIINEIEKVFLISDEGKAVTYDEVRDGLEPVFASKWLEKWQDKVDDRFNEVESTTKAKATNTTRKLNIG